MSNQWLRLWHDMPTDPKWRTISRVSKQPISLVISVYVTLLCSASQNVTRGHADVTLEDIASQLDVTDEEIQSIFDAMQGRVLDSFQLTGWEKRQPKREDSGSETGAKSAAERKRAQRERERALDIIDGHELSRDVTTDKDKDKDKDTEELDKSSSKKSQDKPVKTPRFQKPTIDELRRHIQENQYQVDPDLFFAHYEANGWIVGKSKAPMKCWKSALVTWSKREVKPQGLSQFNQPSKTDALRERNKANLDAFAKRMMEQENAIN